MALASYARNLFGSIKLGDLSLVMIVADIGASGAVTVDTDESSPDVNMTLSTTGQYAITFPKCQTVFPLRPVGLIAEGVGTDLYWETCLASGTGTLEAAVNTAAATAAEPASGTRYYIALLCGQN